MPDRSPFVPVSLTVLALAGVARAEEPGKIEPGRAAPPGATKPRPGAAEPPPGTGDGGRPQAGPGAPRPLPDPVRRGGGDSRATSPAGAASPPAQPTEGPKLAKRSASDPIRPPPLHVEYAQYGVAILALVNLDSGAMCGKSVHSSSAPQAVAPCILGSGGGLVIRAGYRSPGPWYIGGAYAFAKMDSSDLFRLGILQQLWGEMRYLPDTGTRIAPFATWGVGAVAYGNEWGVETGGTMIFGGGGLQFEVSRVAVIGLGFVYKPALIAAWTDTAGYHRPAGVAQFLGFDFQLEVRTETGRR